MRQQPALRVDHEHIIGRRLEINRHAVAVRDHVITGGTARRTHQRIDGFVIMARMQDAPAQDRDRHADFAAVIVGYEQVAAHQHAVLVEAVAADHAGFDDQYQRRLVALADAQHDDRFDGLVAPVPVLADQDIAVLRRFGQRDDGSTFSCGLRAAEAAVEDLGAAIDGDDVFQFLLRAGGDALQLLHDVGIYRLDLRAVDARAFAHLIKGEFRLADERRQVKLYGLGDTVGRCLAMLLTAFMGIAFDADDRKGFVHGFSPTISPNETSTRRRHNGPADSRKYCGARFRK